MESDAGFGLAVRITRPSGVSVIAEYSAPAFDVRGSLDGIDGTLGRVGVRTLLGGVAYTRRVAQLEATAGIAAGYDFGYFHLSTQARDELARRGIFGVTSDASNALVWAPRVSLWQNLNNKLAAGVTVAYTRSTPTIELTSGSFIQRQSIDASAVHVSAGIAYKIF